MKEVKNKFLGLNRPQYDCENKLEYFKKFGIKKIYTEYLGFSKEELQRLSQNQQITKNIRIGYFSPLTGLFTRTKIILIFHGDCEHTNLIPIDCFGMEVDPEIHMTSDDPQHFRCIDCGIELFM